MPNSFSCLGGRIPPTAPLPVPQTHLVLTLIRIRKPVKKKTVVTDVFKYRTFHKTRPHQRTE